MKEFEKLEIPVLIDMLADQTADYSKMLSEGANIEAIKACESWIILLQNEINKRKKAESITAFRQL